MSLRVELDLAAPTVGFFIALRQPLRSFHSLGKVIAKTLIVLSSAIHLWAKIRLSVDSRKALGGSPPLELTLTNNSVPSTLPPTYDAYRH